MRDNFPRSVAVVGNRRLRNCHRVPTSGAYCLRFQLFTSLVKSVTPQMPCTAPPGLAAIRAAAPSHVCLHTKAADPSRHAARRRQWRSQRQISGGKWAISKQRLRDTGEQRSRNPGQFVSRDTGSEKVTWYRFSRGHVTPVSRGHVTPVQRRSRDTGSAEVA